MASANNQAHYITPQGEKRLREELKYLWKVKRPEVTEAVRQAALLGDRSENAEYQYGKKQLREIDRRLRFLDKRLDQLTVVHRLPTDQSRVYFGAWVKLADDQGKEPWYRIVGADESEPSRGLVSWKAPLARALLKKEVGDEVQVRTSEDNRCYEILAIQYSPLE